jgi:FkbM family methyltransferase
MDNTNEFKVKLNLKKIGLPDQSIYLNPKDEGLSDQLLKYCIREPINSYFLVKEIKSRKPHVLDVGGNIGYFPIIEVLSGAKAVSVYEPVTENFDYLTKNMVSFNNVKCYNMGIGETNQTAKIYITNRRNNASIEPCQEYLENNNITIKQTEEVQLITLTDACQTIDDNKILCRMDIEGYEKKVLTNIPEKINGLSFEFHTKIIGKNQSIELIDKLENEGFQITLMTRELEGMMKLFKIFGFTIFKVYNQFKEKRIYIEPKKTEIIKIIKLMRENPHIFAFR